jgi:hypothetical protein
MMKIFILLSGTTCDIKWGMSSFERRDSMDHLIPAAGDHGLWPWRNVQSCDRDVAPHGREAGDHGLCPWGSMRRGMVLLRVYLHQRKNMNKNLDITIF